MKQKIMSIENPTNLEIGFNIVVTRHPGLLEFLDELGIEYDEHITHISDPAILKGKCVLGVLPLHLACQAEYFTELELNIPTELRGKELTLEEVKACAVKFNTYMLIKTAEDAIPQ